MKSSSKCLFATVLVCAVVALGTTPAAADSYLTLNAGVYLPQGDVDELDPGATVNLVYGFNLLPMLWGEVGAGYAKADKDGTELVVVPLTLNGKFRLPIPMVKPYALAGVGIYHTSVDGTGSGSEQDTTFGYQAAVGIDFKILVVKVNLEAEYFWAQPELYGETVHVEGLLATVGVGFEF